MQSLFLLENLHFGIYLAAGLATLACGWLYLDASAGHRHGRTWIGVGGWALLALSFFLGGSRVETTLIDTSFILSHEILTHVINTLRLFGYVGVGLSVLLDPLQKKPEVTGYTKEKRLSPLDKGEPEGVVSSPDKGRPGGVNSPPRVGGAGRGTPGEESPVTAATAIPLFGKLPFAVLHLQVLLPLAALLTTLAYLRRTTIGIERHVRPIAVSFAFYTLYEIAALAFLFRQTNNPNIYRLTASFGPLWKLEHLFLAIAASIMIWWVTRYLLRRFQTQLVMVFLSMSVGIFLVTTISFTMLLLRNIEQAALERLLTDAKTMQFTLTTIERQTISDAELFAGQLSGTTSLRLSEEPVIAIPPPPAGGAGEAIPANTPETASEQAPRSDDTSIATQATQFITKKSENILIITNADGQILFDSINPENAGKSLSENPLVTQSRQGRTASGIMAHEGAISSALSVRASAPILANGQVTGVVITGTPLDNAFVDGIKKATSLDAAIYAGDSLAASTIADENGLQRWLGTQSTDTTALTQVLEEGQPHAGSVTLINTPYLGAYVPLRDPADQPIGMLFVGSPQIDVLKAAGQSLQLTFITAIFLMIFSLIPSSIFAKKLAAQAR